MTKIADAQKQVDLGIAAAEAKVDLGITVSKPDFAALLSGHVAPKLLAEVTELLNEQVADMQNNVNEQVEHVKSELQKVEENVKSELEKVKTDLKPAKTDLQKMISSMNLGQVVVLNHLQLERRCKTAGRGQRLRRSEVLMTESNCKVCRRQLLPTSDVYEVRRI